MLFMLEFFENLSQGVSLIALERQILSHFFSAAASLFSQFHNIHPLCAKS